MEKIKDTLRATFPEKRALVADTALTEKDAIFADSDATASYQRIRQRGHFGTQYDWLARFVRHSGLQGVELCWQKGGRGYAMLMGSLQFDSDAMVLVETPESPDFEIFRPFRFPVIHLTKRDMMENARVSGFLEIMNMTHFCFRPDGKGRPCGWCNPCSFVIEEHMGYRIPWQGHVRRFVWTVTFPTRPIARKPRDWLRRGFTWMKAKPR